MTDQKPRPEKDSHYRRLRIHWRRLLKRLHELEEVAGIVGIDLRLGYSSPKLKFYRRHILEPLGTIFAAN